MFTWYLFKNQKIFTKKTALLLRRVAHILLAVEATNLTENLPDGVAIGVTTGIAREEKHRATSFSEFVSRRQYELQPICNFLSSSKYFHTPQVRAFLPDSKPVLEKRAGLSYRNCGPLRKMHLKLDNYFTLPWFRTLHGIVMMWM